MYVPADEQLLFTFALVVMVSGGIGIIGAATLVYVAWDEYRWDRFIGFLESLADNRLTRPVFNTFIGRYVALMAIEGYIRRGKLRKAEDLAVSEGLVDETLDRMEERGKMREAGRLARRMARKERSEKLYKAFIEECLAQDKPVLAAEAAEEGGLWKEAVRLGQSLEGRDSRLRAARLAAQNGAPGPAIEIFLREGALLDAMRVAEEAGKVDFVLGFCKDSDNPVLHQFGADTAMRVGRPDLGVEILLAHGHLHGAAQYAMAAGLKDQARELIEKLRQRRAAQAREILRKGRGPFGFDFSDDILEETEGAEEDLEAVTPTTPTGPMV
jgi:hypothetical protein